MYIPIYIPIKPMDLWILFDICFVSAGHLKLGLPNWRCATNICKHQTSDSTQL